MLRRPWLEDLTREKKNLVPLGMGEKHTRTYFRRRNRKKNPS